MRITFTAIGPLGRLPPSAPLKLLTVEVAIFSVSGACSCPITEFGTLLPFVRPTVSNGPAEVTYNIKHYYVLNMGTYQETKFEQKNLRNKRESWSFSHTNLYNIISITVQFVRQPHWMRHVTKPKHERRPGCERPASYGSEDTHMHPADNALHSQYGSRNPTNICMD